MIDEELYQQAADELNTDRRRSHIWARACALASDDHDEARYLYTNLRVEELIAERDSGGSGIASQSPLLADEHDITLALEPLHSVSIDDNGDDELFASLDSASLGLAAQDDIPESVSAPSGIDGPEADDDFPQRLDNEKLDDEALSSERAGFEDRMERHFEQQAALKTTEADTESAAHLSEIGESASDDKSLEEDFLDSYAEHQENIKAAAREQSPEEFINNLEMDDTDVNADQRSRSAHDEPKLDFDGTTELDLDPDDIARINDPDQRALSSIHGGDLTGEGPQIDASEQAQNDDSLSWLDDELPRNLPATQQVPPSMPSELNDDSLAQELERQADQLPGQQSDVIEHTDWADEDQLAAYIDNDAIPQSPDLAPLHETATRDHTNALPYNLPVDLTLGESGKEFAIYKRGDNRNQAVSTGVSWSALFFTLPFLIYRHLFGTAILYSVLWIITLGGLLLSGLAWMDAGSAATTLIKASTIGFALLAFIGLLYIPFRYGNAWRGEKLERRGFELIAWVRASTPGKALIRARRETALD